MVHFTADADLYRALAGEPPSGVYPDERTRYLRTIRPTTTPTSPVARVPGAEQIADAIREQLCAGAAIDVPGLGVFDIVERPGRRGAYPDTGAPISVPGRRSVRFRAATALELRLDH